jgi:2-polyprenyl-3-methyl-5-hydroxy-6-metoxy-1,4-benzoquinol methylase
MTDPAWRRANRANWDERVPIHLRSTLHYDQTELRAGRAALDPRVMDAIGTVDGMRILHLQCHFGMDSLTLAQHGAFVTGIDFSAPAIEAATKLAVETGLADRARFVVSDVYETAAALADPDGFDRVLVSWGALCWLPDIAAWARVVAHHLKPGGWLALADAHPAAYVFDSRTALPDGRPGWWAPYFGRAAMIEDRAEDYADPSAVLMNTTTHEFLHPLGDIVTALLDAGLVLKGLGEHDSIPWQMFDSLVRGEDGDYRWPDKAWLPLSFSLRAEKALA